MDGGASELTTTESLSLLIVAVPPNTVMSFGTSRSARCPLSSLSCSLQVVGLAIHFGGMPMNKQLWSLSYVFFMALMMV